MPTYDDYHVPPQAGKFVKNDGSLVNVADIIEELHKKIRDDSVLLMATDAYTATLGTPDAGVTADLAADSAYDYSPVVYLDVDGWKGAEVQLFLDSSGTTDDLVFSVFGSQDGVNFDTVAFYTSTVTATSGAAIVISYLFSYLPAYVKYGVKTTGTTDTFDYAIVNRLFK